MYNNGDAATLHIENAQIPLFQAKIQELLPSLHSRLRFSQLRLPLAVVTGTDRPPTAVNGPAAAVLRMYQEETVGGEDPSEWYCLHLIVVSTLRMPQTLSFELSALPTATRGQTITAQAIFEENYGVAMNVSASGTASFSDAIGSFETKFYRFGCARPAANASNMVVDPSFEGFEHAAGFQGLSTMEYRGPWAVACNATRMIGDYALCDPRLHARWSTAEPRSGRHALHVQIPTAETVAFLSFPQQWPAAAQAQAGPVTYRAEIWARSSPHRVNATLRVGWREPVTPGHKEPKGSFPPGTVAATELLAAGEWTRVAVSFTNATRGDLPLVAQLWLRPTVGVAATVWVDDASIVAV